MHLSRPIVLAEPVKSIKIVTKGRSIRRGRIYSSGILPEYTGSGLFNLVRNEVLLEFSKRDISEVESSYVDLSNQRSPGNVLSKEGVVMHKFSVFRACKA